MGNIIKALPNYRWHLRVSALPDCNLRCRYCNPDGICQAYGQASEKEMRQMTEAAVFAGIVRQHITGGEPCLLDIVDRIAHAKKVGMKRQIMTTNGTMKADEIPDMKKAGLNRVNISLDTMRPKRYQDITGRNFFENVITFVETACQVFDEVVKVNMVPMQENVDEIVDLITFARKFPGKLAIKLIELCPNNPAFYEEQNIAPTYISYPEIKDRLRQIGILTPMNIMGDNPMTECYVVGTTGVRVILIPAVSVNFQCGGAKCRKMRVSPFGLLASCINQEGENFVGLSLKQKVELIQKLMAVRETYNDTGTIQRQHINTRFGKWRFGNTGTNGKLEGILCQMKAD